MRLADAQAALVDCLGDPQCDEARLAQALQAADAVRREAAVEQLREDLRQLFVDTRYGLGQIGELVSGLRTSPAWTAPSARRSTSTTACATPC